MKKTLQITALVFMTGFTTINAQNVNIPDANFKAYLVGNALINTNSDTEIQVSEAAAYTGTIGCENLNITSLVGIEAFTSLGSLFCGLNSLTSLDVTSNTSLVALYCNNNQLTSLNINNNISLTEFDCNNNQITTLDASNNPQLNSLVCNDNQLSSLNMRSGGNTNLFNNAVVLNNNPNLTCIEVDDSTYSATNWTNIDGGAHFSTNCGLSTGIEFNHMSTNINIFPNPTTGTIFLSNSYNVTMTDITGKVIFAKTNTNSVDISIQPTGMYFLLLTDNKGQIVQRNKVTKE